MYGAVIEAMDRLPLPIFPSFATSISAADALSRYRAAGRCHFEDEVSMARAAGRMVNRPRLSNPAPGPAGYDGQAAAGLLKDVTGVVPPDLTRKVLQAAGIRVPGERRVGKPEELAGLTSSLPAPWVMKVIGPLHKSARGGVVTGAALADAEKTFERLMKITGARGVLVQETVQGPEVIMGLSREGEFGHLVAFGLGGVLAILNGYRGQPGMDLDRVADILVRVSLLGRDIPAITEMDINPLKGVLGALAAVDVRIIVE